MDFIHVSLVVTQNGFYACLLSCYTKWILCMFTWLLLKMDFMPVYSVVA